MQWNSRPRLSIITELGRLRIQYEVNGRQQEVNAIRLGHQRIYRLQSAVRQFEMLRQHDDGNFWADLFDFGGYNRAVQKAQVVFEHNRIHGLRHEKPQSLVTSGGGYQFVSAFLQQAQLRRVPGYAKQSAVCSHDPLLYRGGFPRCCSKLLTFWKVKKR